MKICAIPVLFCLMLSGIDVEAQQVWVGTFKGNVNGDAATLTLQSAGPGKVKGTLKDTYQTFEVTGETTGNRFAGDAKENTLGLAFVLLGELNGNTAEMKLVFELLGQISETPFTLIKQNSSSTTSAANNSASTKAKTGGTSLPAGAKLDPNVVGKWTKNETYNSGYGDNFMGGNFSQSLIFMADGSVAEGSSSASIGGSNYSGSSKGAGSGVIDGLRWYTKANMLWLSIDQNGQKQEVELGRYYIENNRMLITGKNGEKILLSR